MRITLIAALLVTYVFAQDLCGPRDTGITTGTAGSGDWELRWELDCQPDATQSNIVFTVSAVTQGWVGLGLSTSGSKLEADVAMASLLPGGGVLVTDRYGVLEDVEPEEDVLRGGVNNLIPLEVTQEGDVLTARFQRQLQTGDDSDQVVSDREFTVLWAYGQNAEPPYDQHCAECFGKLSINFFEPIVDRNVLRHHGGMEIWSWVIFAMTGVYSARFLKHHWFWIYVHLGCLSCSIFLSFVSFFYIASRGPDYGFSFTQTHAFLGLFVFIGMLAQFAFGVANLVLFDAERKQAPFFPDVVHWFLGRAVLLVALFNVMLGLDRFRAHGAAFALSIIGIVFAAVVFVASDFLVGRTYRESGLEDAAKDETEKQMWIAEDAKRKKRALLLNCAVFGVLFLFGNMAIILMDL